MGSEMCIRDSFFTRSGSGILLNLLPSGPFSTTTISSTLAASTTAGECVVAIQMESLPLIKSSIASMNLGCNEFSISSITIRGALETTATNNAKTLNSHSGTFGGGSSRLFSYTTKITCPVSVSLKANFTSGKKYIFNSSCSSSHSFLLEIHKL